MIDAGGEISAGRRERRIPVPDIAAAAAALADGYRFEGIERHDGHPGRAVFARLVSDPEGPTRASWPPMPDPISDGTVTLRPIRPDDWPVYLAEQNNAESRRWNFSGAMVSERGAREVCALAPLNWLVASTAQLVICEAGTMTGAGTIQLRRFGPPDTAGIGYGVLPEFRGRRFTTHALELLCGWVFSQTPIARLELGCKRDNLASARAAEAAGFFAEGALRARLRNPDGTFSDELRFARLRPTE